MRQRIKKVVAILIELCNKDDGTVVQRTVTSCLENTVSDSSPVPRDFAGGAEVGYFALRARGRWFESNLPCHYRGVAQWVERLMFRLRFYPRANMKVA